MNTYAPTAKTKTFKISLLVIVLLGVLMTSFSTGLLVSALGNPIVAPQATSLGYCGTLGDSYNTILEQQPPSGTVYARLVNGETPTSVSLYNQNFNTNACTPVGSATVSQNTWTRIGSFQEAGIQPDVIVANSTGLQLGGPYQAALSLLILPTANTCNIATNCGVSYDGFTATLQPIILSAASDQIAIYEAKPVAGIGYSKVDYYANNQFLYSGTTLKPINRNYLSSGMQYITIEVSLKNGEQLSIAQTINMGPDYTGELAIKSYVYRVHDKGLFFVVVGGSVLLLCAFVWTSRYLYKRHREYARHFAADADYKGPEDHKDDGHDSGVVVS